MSQKKLPIDQDGARISSRTHPYGSPGSAFEVALLEPCLKRTLLEREAWLATILQSTADPTIVTDAQGCLQFLNSGAEQLLGCVLADICGQYWRGVVRLFQGSSDMPAEDLVSLAFQQTATRKFARGTVLRSINGQQIAVDGNVTPTTLNGIVAGAVVTIRDLDELNRRQAEFRHEQKVLALGRMVGGMAHYFNNLLTVILGHGYLLSERSSDPTDIASLQAILDAAGTAAAITRQLLKLSHKQIDRAETIHLNGSVRRCCKILAPTLGPGIEVHEQFTSGAGSVFMAPASLDQIVMNLLLNAAEAMNGHGSIVLATSNLDHLVTPLDGGVTERFLRLTVTDAGMGIAPEMLEHIFEPFSTTKPHTIGTALGLAIAHALIKEVGGEIEVISTLGMGASFTVVLPRSPDDD